MTRFLKKLRSNEFKTYVQLNPRESSKYQRNYQILYIITYLDQLTIAT